MRAPALALLLLACTAPGGRQGVASPGPDAGPTARADSGLGSVGISCTKGEEFCEGSVLWRCTYNGTDASKVGDCGSSLVCGPHSSCAPNKACCHAP